jgi:hypothetical protein
MSAAKYNCLRRNLIKSNFGAQNKIARFQLILYKNKYKWTNQNKRRVIFLIKKNL